MKAIAYVLNGNVVIQVNVVDSDDFAFEYIVVDSDSIPNTPQSTWYIEDGEIKIDQQKLIEFNRQNMPTLSPIEFDIKLVDVRLYDQVQELIQSDIKLRIAYTRATFFSRLDPFIIQASEALGLTPEQVDAMWTTPQ